MTAIRLPLFSKESSHETQRLWWPLATLFICGGLGVIGVFSWWSWQQSRTEVVTSLRVVAQFVADNAQAVFEELGNDLPYLSLELRTRSTDLPADYKLLQTYQKFHPSVASMVLFSPSGKMLLNTAVPFGKKLPDPRIHPAFLDSLETTLKSHTQWIGQTQIGLVLHGWRIPVRYVVRDMDGKPLFILQASVRLTAITSAWARLSLPQNTAVGLLRYDGYHIARLPAKHAEKIYSTQVNGALFKTLHRHPTQRIGTYIGKVQTDDTYRLGSYVYLSGYPMVAYASRSNDEIISDWARRVLPFIALGMFSIMGFVGLAYLLIKREKRHVIELSAQAKRQGLTGLPNRFGAQEWLERQLDNGVTSLSALQIDIQNFKDINTALGTEAGDSVLQEIGKRLRMRADYLNGFISHLDADEFLLGLPGAGPIKAHATAQSIRQLIKAPLELEGRTLHLQARIGVACIPEDAQNSADLLRSLDAAVHAAKQGPSGISFYDAKAGRMSDARVNFQHAIERALENDELKLFYQPIVLLASGEIIGAEALLRWDDPERGLLLPGEFIAIAETTGWIAPLGEWVFRRACQDMKHWESLNLDLYISVNLSASQFNSPELLEYIQKELQTAGVSAGHIELEITETTVMDDVIQSASIMEKIRNLGLQLAIDDFGTGYSSLSYLRKLPAQTIKIDQSFIRDIDINLDDLEIVKAIVALTKALRRKTVAEGIESKEQHSKLKALGVEMGQGYLFCKPLTRDKFLHVVNNNKGLI